METPRNNKALPASAHTSGATIDPSRGSVRGVPPSRRPRDPPRDTLFTAAARRDPEQAERVPLAERMRPRTVAEFVGQAHLFGPHRLLGQAVASDRIPSMILWGPPGVGKTTVGRIIAEQTQAKYVPFSAVLGNLQDLRAIVAEARERLAFDGKRTVVFVDEIHRFNKAQQDAFLPHVEDGTITLVGATTENPSFAVNAALLSRCKVFRLDPLADEDLVRLLKRALLDETRGLGALHLEADADALGAVASLARGDARRALSALEGVSEHAKNMAETRITRDLVMAANDETPLLYDKAGEEHYNVVSAFIKSMRGSDPDAAVYWMLRMVEAGEDPLFVLRRMLIFASEDVGNADPRAIMVVVACDQAFQRVGMPEGLYPLAHAAVYLACSLKSNAVSVAWQRARELVASHGALPVPKKLRNAVTALMRGEGYGEGYKYAHAFEGGVVPGETYLPDELAGHLFYEPVDRGEEARIRQRLDTLRAARAHPRGGDER
jgi:putative ATPase